MVDLYCERLGPGLWAEPINAVTNLAFFIAAWASWSAVRARCLGEPGISILVLLLAAIGAGSALFHTFATDWARLLDVVPILLFQLCFLWFYLERVVALSRSYSVLVVGGFMLVTLASRQWSEGLNGSLVYLPAFVFLLGLGVFHALQEKRERFVLLAGACIFAVALAFRTVDMAACPFLPVGTHFLWHLLNAAVLYLAMRAAIANSLAPAGSSGIRVSPRRRG